MATSRGSRTRDGSPPPALFRELPQLLVNNDHLHRLCLHGSPVFLRSRYTLDLTAPCVMYSLQTRTQDVVDSQTALTGRQSRASYSQESSTSALLLYK